MHANQLSGPIPTSIGLLTNLTFLDVSTNSLFGTVPSSLAAINATAANFKVFSNQLSGTLPSNVAPLYPVGSSSWAYNCITGCTNQFTGCDLSERTMLVDLFTSTNRSLAGWTVATGWLSSAHPCTWFGVTCAAASLTTGPVVYVNGDVAVLPGMCMAGRGM